MKPSTFAKQIIARTSTLAELRFLDKAARFLSREEADAEMLRRSKLNPSYYPAGVLC